MLLPLQRARRRADRRRQRRRYGFAKASAATALCAYSFAAVAGRHAAPLQRRHVRRRDRHERRQLGRARASTTRATSPIALATPRANNVVFAERLGDALRSHARPGSRPTARPGSRPGSRRSCSGRPPIRESGAPAVVLRGRRRRARRRCAARPARGSAAPRASGNATIDLGGARRRAALDHGLRQSYADAETQRTARSRSRVDRTAPAQPLSTSRPMPPRRRPAGGVTRPSRSRSRRRPRPTSPARRCASTAPRARSCIDETSAGALTSAAIPASALAAAAPTSSTSSSATPPATARPPRAPRCAGTAPAARARRRPAPPLGVLAARDGAHLTWPALGPPRGAAAASPERSSASGPRPRPRAPRRSPPREWEAGVPGTSDDLDPAGVRSTAREQVCLAVRPVSGAGHRRELGRRALRAGRRAAAGGDGDRRPALERRRADRGPGRRATRTARPSRRCCSTASRRRPPATRITVAGEGPHVLRAVARDGAGNETVVERALGVDASAPVIGDVAADFVARELRVGVRDALAGVALAEVRLGGTALETTDLGRRRAPRSRACRPASRWTAPPWSCASRMPRARPTRRARRDPARAHRSRSCAA